METIRNMVKQGKQQSERIEDMDYAERRAHPRAYFSTDEGISALLERSSPDGTESMLLYGRVTSLSEGGISFVGLNPALMNLNKGDVLKLVRITEPEMLGFLQDVTLLVRHSIYEEETEHILAGCQFMDISQDAQKQIRQFVTVNLNGNSTDS